MNFSSLASFVLVAIASVACSVSSAEEDQPEPVVDGVFRLEGADPRATIHEMEFRDVHYWLVPSGCTDESCKEHGTFTIDRANRLLELVVEGSGRKYRLPFEITSTRHGPDVTGASRPSSFAGQLTPTGESLVAGKQELVGQSKLTVGSFKLVEQTFLLENDDCGGRDMVTIAKRMCADFKVPTKAPRIRCILMNDQDHCNSASKQSCLADTPDNDALSRFDSYRDACQGSGNVALETVSSMNNGLNPFVMTVCCKAYTCADGVRIDGTSVTGKQGETVCGTSGTKWWCGPGGKTEGVGEWKNLNVACDR